jgi:hypothetical protein
MGLRCAALGFERFAVICAAPRLDEAGGRLIERLNVPIDTGEHRTAFQCRHDVERARFGVGTADPARQVVNAAAEKGKNFPRNIGRQRTRCGPQHTAKAHPSVSIERLSKRQAVRAAMASSALSFGCAATAARNRSPYRRATAVAIVALVGK